MAAQEDALPSASGSSRSRAYQGKLNLDVLAAKEPPEVASMPLGPHAGMRVVLLWVYDNLCAKASGLDLSACPGRRAYQLWALARDHFAVRNRVVKGVLDLKDAPPDKDAREAEASAAKLAESEAAVVDGYRKEAEVLCGKLKSFEAMMKDWDPHGLTLRLLGEIRAAQQED